MAPSIERRARLAAVSDVAVFTFGMPIASPPTTSPPVVGGGLRSHRGAGGRTRAQLYNEAKARGIKGRSRMSKAQLLEAVDAPAREK